jgi:putative ABC transport system permease protein
VRPTDILRLALSALYQQKVRTALTTLGVVIGTVVLVVSLSVGQGVQEAAVRQFRRYDQLRKVEVWPRWAAKESDIPEEKLRVPGDMSEAKRQRLRQAIVRRWRWEDARGVPRVPLTRERVRELEAIEHVEEVVPVVELGGWASLGDRSQEVMGFAVTPDNRAFANRVVAGSPFSSPSERSVLLSEYLLYQWGIVDDADVGRVVGRKLRLEIRPMRRKSGLLLMLFGTPGGSPKMTPEDEKVLEKATRQLQAALGMLDLTPAERESLWKLLRSTSVQPEPGKDEAIVEEFTVAGVLRDFTNDEVRNLWERLNRDSDVILPLQTAEELFHRLPTNAEQGFRQVTVTADSEEHVKEVAAKVRELGLESFSLAEAVEQMRFTVMLITFALAFVAAVALVVSALGITNTMLMSVLERTHEIGVMKAVGARDGHVQALFLVEGALVGAAGGGLGLLLGWLLSFPGDAVAKSLVEKQVELRLEESLFAFPLWLTLGVPLFACVVTTLAAVYPARRAARVNPITALRHE